MKRTNRLYVKHLRESTRIYVALTPNTVVGCVYSEYAMCVFFYVRKRLFCERFSPLYKSHAHGIQRARTIVLRRLSTNRMRRLVTPDSGKLTGYRMNRKLLSMVK